MICPCLVAPMSARRDWAVSSAVGNGEVYLMLEQECCFCACSWQGKCPGLATPGYALTASVVMPVLGVQPESLHSPRTDGYLPITSRDHEYDVLCSYCSGGSHFSPQCGVHLRPGGLNSLSAHCLHPASCYLSHHQPVFQLAHRSSHSRWADTLAALLSFVCSD